MSVIIKGGINSNLANVDSNSSLQVNTPTTATTAGYILAMSENDNGSLFGTKKVKSTFVSEDRRLSVGLDTPAFNYTFNATTQDTGCWRYVTATMTTTWGTTGMLLNAIQTLTTGTGTAVSSWKQFTLIGNGTTEFELSLLVTDTIVANQVLEFGVFPFGAGTATPTEGVYLRFSTAGLLGVINFNTTETTTGVLMQASAVTINQVYVFTIRVNERLVQFYRDGALLGELAIPAAQGQPFITTTLPITFQFRNAGTVSGGATAQAKVLDVFVNQKDINLGKPYSAIQAAQGLMGYQGTNGNTMGSTALYTNSLAPGAGAVMTNTTAALGTGLGGQFAALPTLAANTDGIICSFQVPVGSINIVPRTLYITGIKLQGAVTTVLVGNATPVHYAYSLAFGHTAVSLATAEAVAAKAPRRIALGYETFAAAAAIGVIGQGVSMSFASPIVVNPGEFVAVVAKNIGVVTTTGVITFLVTFDCYWE